MGLRTGRRTPRLFIAEISAVPAYNPIQKKLFNNVVRRWRENITFTLNQVFFDEAIAVRVHERMVALSRYIDAHSHSDEFHEEPLTPSVVTTELDHFDAIKTDYTKARKAWEKANEKPKLYFN